MFNIVSIGGCCTMNTSFSSCPSIKQEGLVTGPERRRILGLCIVIIFLSFQLIPINNSNTHTKNPRRQLIPQYPSMLAYDNHSSIAILGPDGFVVWPGSGTSDDPYIIEGLKIISAQFCLYVAFTSVYFIVRDCYFESSSIASRTVLFDNVTNGEIVNCIIKSATNGIEMDISSNCSIINCTIYDSEIGIYVNQASNVTLDGNRVYRNPMGIRINNSTDCTIIRNTVYRNSIRGIFLNHYTQNCTLYNNILGWNRGASPVSTEQNAFDDGTFNLWDDNISQGNFWSDFEEEGPYEINGIAHSFDRYPSLFSDDEIPTLNHPEDISYDYGTENNTISWNCSDEYPCMYQIHHEGIQLIERTWDGGMIIINIDHLPTGTYNYTLVLSDPIHTVVDTVIIRVYVDILSDISPELLIISSILSIIFVVLVLLIVKQIR